MHPIQKVSQNIIQPKTLIESDNWEEASIEDIESGEFQALECIEDRTPRIKESITKNFTTEASIHTNFLRDLYIVLGEGNMNDGWVVRIYYNPLVIWIWIGSLTIFLGGIVSMTSNLKKLKQLIK